MAHSWHHAESSARKYGGDPQDYLDVHTWFDATKSHLALPSHRALRHHTMGIFEAEIVFGPIVTTSDGRVIPTRWIGEQHVREDCRRIPTPADWLTTLPILPWMVNGTILPDIVDPFLDPIEDWRQEVANGLTVKGYQDWSAEQRSRGQLG